jgi:hypothetical protein
MSIVFRTVVFITILFSHLFAIKSYQELKHVKDFYDEIAPISVELGMKYNVPPAAIMAIAGVESGYGRGYVSRITGNILSLGAAKSETALPSLTLPVLKNGRVLYNQKEISKYSKEQLVYKKRPKSLKKDYRPKPIYGTNKNLDYFDNNPLERRKAIKQNIKDFVTKWISKNHTYSPFKNSRTYLDKNKDKLFTKEVSQNFISIIGGVPNGFNYRKSWVKKVNIILRKAHLIELANKLKK